MTVLDQRIAALASAGRLARASERTLASVALARTAEDPDRVIVMDGERSVTRGEMLDVACRLGGALLSRGIAPGAIIGLQSPNWWEACAINLAACLFGYRLAPLLTMYRAAELGFILPACGVAAVFAPERFRNIEHAALIASSAGAPRHIFTLRGEASSRNAFEHLIQCEPAKPSPAPADDVKMILFTSGSTGRPKGVMHSHAAFDVLISRTADFWRIGPDDRLLVPSPIGHIGGSIYAFEFPWITGCAAALAESWDPDDAVRKITIHGATFMAGATPFLAGLIAAAERAGSNLPSLRRFICGGASIPPELVRRGLKQFSSAVVSRAYGSTEIPLVCPGVRDREEAEERADTDGECTTELQLLTDQGLPVADGESGEIAVRAPQMFVGYLDPADEEGAFTQDGFFRMGDLGRRVSGRFIEITGRKKDIIIRKGENISPLEIENALARHQSVRQSAVVGAPDAARGEIVVAFVLPADGASFTFTDMTNHLEEMGLAKQKYPERLHIVSSLPLNSVGKVQKSELKALAMRAGGTRG